MQVVDIGCVSETLGRLVELAQPEARQGVNGAYESEAVVLEDSRPNPGEHQPKFE
jgi:hypothetical protein